MSFLEGLGRLLRGKPVFVPPEQGQAEQQQPGASGAPVVPPPTQQEPAPQQPTGPKIVPQLTFGRVECRQNGTQMQCDCWIRNTSNVQLDLDRLMLLGTTRDMGTFLRPGEERRFTIYNGNSLKGTGDNRCELNYKDHTGDWFRAHYWIEFQPEASNTYSILRFNQMPTEDIGRR